MVTVWFTLIFRMRFTLRTPRLLWIGYVRIVLWFFGHAGIVAVQSIYKPQPKIKIPTSKNNPTSTFGMNQQPGQALGQAVLIFLKIVVELAAFSDLGDIAGADDEVAEALAVGALVNVSF